MLPVLVEGLFGFGWGTVGYEEDLVAASVALVVHPVAGLEEGMAQEILGDVAFALGDPVLGWEVGEGLGFCVLAGDAGGHEACQLCEN